MSSKKFAAFAGVVAVATLAVACAQGSTPAQASRLTDRIEGAAHNSGSAGLHPAASPFGGHGVPLVEVAGSVPAGGSGTLNDTQTAEPGFNNFEVTVNVHGAPPNTDLAFQFVADILPATRGDGVCPAAFPDPPANTIQLLHTSAGGTVSTHVKFEGPEGAALGTFDSGQKADFKWRVVDLSNRFELQTPCVVLTGK